MRLETILALFLGIIISLYVIELQFVKEWINDNIEDITNVFNENDNNINYTEHNTTEITEEIFTFTCENNETICVIGWRIDEENNILYNNNMPFV